MIHGKDVILRDLYLIMSNRSTLAGVMRIVLMRTTVIQMTKAIARLGLIYLNSQYEEKAMRHRRYACL